MAPPFGHYLCISLVFGICSIKRNPLPQKKGRGRRLSPGRNTPDRPGFQTTRPQYYEIFFKMSTSGFIFFARKLVFYRLMVSGRTFLYRLTDTGYRRCGGGLRGCSDSECISVGFRIRIEPEPAGAGATQTKRAGIHAFWIPARCGAPRSAASGRGSIGVVVISKVCAQCLRRGRRPCEAGARCSSEGDGFPGADFGAASGSTSSKSS